MNERWLVAEQTSETTNPRQATSNKKERIEKETVVYLC